ncbi:MAG TPA: phosphatase PAP2-related protein [Candidatus Paceibacterota bacterium]|nr:phosphatase PAP2-related protein [Candidatus Paceibacterota bacterium]
MELSLKKRYKFHWTQKIYIQSTVIALLLFTFSVWVNFWANNYAQQSGQNAVTDIVLNNVPVLNVNFAMTYLVAMVIIFVAALLLLQPRRMPFTLKSLALFTFIRSIFISVTHIAQFTPRAPIDAGPILNFIGSGNTGGLFFSGHTGVPFLLALVFWDSVVLRCIFIGLSIFYAATVLLGHLHYTIDVLGAYFVTYTIYHIAVRWFKKDYQFSIKRV